MTADERAWIKRMIDAHARLRVAAEDAIERELMVMDYMGRKAAHKRARRARERAERLARG